MPRKTPALPAPKRNVHKRKFMSCEVDVKLLAAVRKEKLRNQITFRQVIEWGMRAYLAESNPQALNKCG